MIWKIFHSGWICINNSSCMHIQPSLHERFSRQHFVLLANLSRRLMELAYSIPMTMASIGSSILILSVNIFKHLWNHWERNWNWISYAACFGIDNRNMTILSMSHDQNVFHARSREKTIQKIFVSETNGQVTFGLGIVSLGIWALQSLFKWWS